MNKIRKIIATWLFSQLTKISPELNTKVRYRLLLKKKLDLNNPVTLNEKILKLKLDSYETNPLVRMCADKYAVRKYIAEKQCDEILVPLLGVYEDPDEIDWNELPNEFVVKWNFGCGYNIICPDKSKLDIPKTIKQLKKWKSHDYYLENAEMQYKDVKKVIIIEKYLRPKNGLMPSDYKVYCFNGRPLYVMICLDRELGKPKFLYYDRNFVLQRNLSRSGLELPQDFSMPKPDAYDELFHYAELLSKPFDFVRSDFYLVDGQVYFGELTFTPSAGTDKDRLPQVDKYFGSLLNLSNK